MSITGTWTSAGLRYFAHLQDHGATVDFARGVVSFPTIELFVQLVTPEQEFKLTAANLMILRPGDPAGLEDRLRAEQRQRQRPA
ncbi:hypothetical protein [Deinococcus soli (ex Cha et al. 2016)]|uniref:Uncharacterized protein n=2 Tax=Deinococcus soli (ex Cha et al. 2016) TaxID=1309411 RepID=A0AAE3XDD0_9DEIO|nr:hypothetical protein [Deinococcus soli (ex Cha et al. 2016)]MDR6218589.1 hypothetical protein [Deinococcus soli (ex Cha et al. 2016)]MDR6328386.1 hypothetical protein [Deinococcus soli (ex Cha et al. 2016)]MDR6752997.1 hypothetical protein [Deinococcus soli (ex Cha et al. 2016)]